MSILKLHRDRSRARRSGRPAFTLLELIVVLLVLGILAAISVPTFNRVKQNAVARTAQTTLEVLDRNGEAIAFSDPDMSDEQIAASAVSEVTPPEGVTITRAGAQITVQNVSGSVLAEGTVTFSDGVGTIDPAVADPDGASGSSGSSGSSSSSSPSTTAPSTTVAPSTTTTLALQAPAAPSLVSVLRGDLSLVLNWTSSPTASSPVTGFKVYLDGVLVDGDVAASETSYTFPALLDGTSYVLGVRAVNTVGESTVSESSPTEALSTPPAPAGLAVVPTAAASTRLDLSWSTVTGAVVSGYNVYRFNPSTSLYETVGLTSSSSFSDTGLTAGVAYDYKVSAYNAFAEGALSDAVSATPIAVPLAPTGVSASQGNAAATITWSWGAGNAYPGSDDRPITGVTLKACTDQGMSENCLTETPTVGDLTAASYTWSGLVNGTGYYFAVVASNGVGDVESDPSSPITPYQPPTAAPTLTVTVCTDNSTPACSGGQTLKLSWTAVTATAAEPVAGYEVYRLNPTSGVYEIISVTTNTTYTSTGLVNGTGQSFKVAAYNATATGALSNAGTATPYTVPGSPTNVSATASNTSATFTFSAPSSNGGSAVTDYTVTCANTSGGSAATTTGSASPLVVTLVTGQSYTCTMTAANAAGTGAASGTVTLTATYTSQGNYTCPSGGSLSGSTCTQTYTYYTYSCMPGGTLSGSTCYAPYGSEAYGPGVGCNTHYGWYDYGGGCASAPYTHGPHYSYSSYSATWVDTSYWSRTVT